MTSPNPEADDIVSRLENFTGDEALTRLLKEAAETIRRGRRIFHVHIDTLQELRAEYFNLAVAATSEAKGHPLLPRRLELRELANQCKNKVRYLENVLNYDGSFEPTKLELKPANGNPAKIG